MTSVDSGSNSLNKTGGDENVVSLREFLRVFWRRLWVIALVTCTFLAMSIGFSLVQVPIYQATTEIVINKEQNPDTAAILSSDAEGLQKIAQTIVEAVDSRPTAEAVSEELDSRITPEQVLAGLDVRQVPETQFIQISYGHPDPEQAQEIANTIGEVFSEQQISNVSPGAGLTATVWEQAQRPASPISPNPVRSAALGLALGLTLGLGLAFLLEYLNDSWRSSPKELEQVSGVPNLGVVPKFAVSRANRKGGHRGDRPQYK